MIQIPNFTIDRQTPNDRVEFPDTAPGPWNHCDSTMWTQFHIVMENYNAANPGGHLAIFNRCYISGLYTGQINGHGLAIGSLIGSHEGITTRPGIQLETRGPGVASPLRHLLPDSGGPQLSDGMMYRMTIHSTRRDGLNYVGYKLEHARGDVGAYDCLHDTGQCHDNNPGIDMTQSGLAFGTVFNTHEAKWAIHISGLSVQWEPPVTMPDNSPIYKRLRALESA